MAGQADGSTPMMNRRRFLGAAVSAALVSHLPNAHAAAYDLIVRGGRVIDPSLGLDDIRDIGITAGRIAAVEAALDAEASRTIDARGKIVVPGLIDIHTHAGRDAGGPALALRDGVTALIDAGTAGADNIDAVAAVLRAAPQPSYALLNIARTGVITEGELNDIEAANVALARGAIARNLDVVVGVKARLSETVVGRNDLEALRRAREAAAPFDLPVMIHVGQSYSPLRAILPLLERGDIVTHMYAPPPNGILDEDGRLFPDVAAARRRGVVFDFGHGVVGHFTWEMLEQATAQGFWPDTLSTDWNVMSRGTGVVDFPNVMSKFLAIGMPLAEVVACATTHAAQVFPVFRDRGTLNPGAPADVAVMELRDGRFELVDNYEGTRIGRQRLFPAGTVLGGEPIRREG
jgi:dihydroorotase